jgi:hypothetical protein
MEREAQQRRHRSLDNALTIEPRHWLAVTYSRPSSIDRRRFWDAAHERQKYDKLLGSRRPTDNPLFARVYEYRGQLFSREHKDDSAAAI